MFNNQMLEYSAKSSGFAVWGGSAGGTDGAEESGWDVAETGGRNEEAEGDWRRTVDESVLEGLC